MSATQAEIDAMLSPQSLEILLTRAIVRVKANEVPAEILAKAIMVTIQTEVNRAKIELVSSLTSTFAVHQ